MAAYVKCFYCGKQFDREKEPYIKVGKRRYAHQECSLKDYENYSAEKTKVEIKEENDIELTQEEKDLIDLENYIKNLFNEEFVSAKVRKQIKEFKTNYGYSYSGMLKTLIWFYDIKKNPKDKSNGGIGIVPFVYQQACDFFYSVYKARLLNTYKQQQDYVVHTKEIFINAPVSRPKKKIKLFDMEDD